MLCNTSAELRTSRQVAQPSPELNHAQRPQLRCPEKRDLPATPPQQDLLLPLQKRLRTQPPETPLQREPKLELSYASHADSEVHEVIPDSADEASVLQDTEVEVSSQHDPQPQTASQTKDEGGWEELEQEQLQQEMGRAGALTLAQDGTRAVEERAMDMQRQMQQTQRQLGEMQRQLKDGRAALQAARDGRRGAEERAALLQRQLDEAQLQQYASGEALQVIQDGQQAAEEMAADLQQQLAEAQREQESGSAALRAAQAGQQAAKDGAKELKHHIRQQLQRLVAYLLRQLDDSKAALQAAQNSKRAAEEKATDLQRQLGEAQRQQEADKEALQAAQECLLGEHAAKEKAAHAQHQMEEARRRLLPVVLFSMIRMGHEAEREAPEGTSRAAEAKVADLQRQLGKAQRAQFESAGVQAELVGLTEQLQQTKDFVRTGQNACLIVRAQRYTFEARLSRCEQAFLAQGGLILHRPGEQPNPGGTPQHPSIEPMYQVLDYGQAGGQTMSFQDFFLSLPAAGREAAALQAAAQHAAQAAPQVQPAVAPSRGLEIAAAKTLTAMQMGAA